MESTSTYPENNAVQPSIGSVAIKGGVITGVIIASLIIVFIYVLNNIGSMALQILIGLISTIIGIYLTQKSFKDQGDGYMTYGKGLIIAIAMMAVAGLVASLINLIYVKFVDPQIAEQIVDISIEKAYEMTERFGGDTDALDAQFEGKREEMIADQTNFINILWGSLTYAFFGLIVGLIVTIFTKNKPAELEY